MQIPNIRSVVTFPVNYFLESSWKGKTVCVLCAASLCWLIYYVAFRKKTPPQGTGTLTTNLSNRAQNQPPVRNTHVGSESSLKRGTQTQPQAGTTLKRSDASSTHLSRGVQRQPQVQSVILPKADLSYIQTHIHSDLAKLNESEFGPWLSHQRESFKECTTLANGNQSQQASCYMSLKKIIPELKAQAEKMMPLFDAHRELKKSDWNVFFQECDAVIADRKTHPLDSCMKLKACLDTFESWDKALHHLKTTKLMKMLQDTSICPHYEFTNLQTQYFHYLGLHTKEDFTRLLSANITHLETFGLRVMEDVDCLQLRAMQPSIERLRQLICFLTINGDERAPSQILGSSSQKQEGLSLTQPQSKIEESVRKETLHSQIEKEIGRCREVLKKSNNLSDALNNTQDSQDLQKTVKLLNELFDELSSNFANGLDLLKKIENNDIARQLILLKGYINQYGQKAKWQQLNEMGILRLAQYADVFKPDTFYRMGD